MRGKVSSRLWPHFAQRDTPLGCGTRHCIQRKCISINPSRMQQTPTRVHFPFQQRRPPFIASLQIRTDPFQQRHRPRVVDLISDGTGTRVHHRGTQRDEEHQMPHQIPHDQHVDVGIVCTFRLGQRGHERRQVDRGQTTSVHRFPHLLVIPKLRRCEPCSGV